MSYLHLPADHSDADLMLAASVAARIGSEDLYVAWTQDTGPGAVPEIEAIVREQRPSALVALIAGVVSGALAMWHGLTQAAAAAPAAAAQPRATAGEPSA